MVYSWRIFVSQDRLNWLLGSVALVLALVSLLLWRRAEAVAGLRLSTLGLPVVVWFWCVLGLNGAMLWGLSGKQKHYQVAVFLALFFVEVIFLVAAIKTLMLGGAAVS